MPRAAGTSRSAQWRRDQKAKKMQRLQDLSRSGSKATEATGSSGRPEATKRAAPSADESGTAAESPDLQGVPLDSGLPPAQSAAEMELRSLDDDSGPAETGLALVDRPSGRRKSKKQLRDEMFDGEAQGPPPAGFVGGGQLLANAMGVVHEGIAHARNYDGWLLTENGKGMFKTIGDWLVQLFGWKNLPVIFAVVGLIGMYAAMAMGDIEYHKHGGGAPQAGRVPPGATGQPPAAAPSADADAPPPGVVLP